MLALMRERASGESFWQLLTASLTCRFNAGKEVYAIVGIECIYMMNDFMNHLSFVGHYMRSFTFQSVSPSSWSVRRNTMPEGSEVRNSTKSA